MLKFLINTYVFLWYVINNKQWRDNHKIMINERENLVYLSQASIWEMAIKYSLGKLTFDSPFREFIESQIQGNDWQILPLNLLHFEQVAQLPFQHREPFDRMIMAQSITENVPDSETTGY
ncbi:MAG: type II toxin-antitoxin system VapC family toxin [Microcystis aeruginosa Ma_QC_C_20070703_M131]|jgi:PIN domain nuclease of toxin-antitoxin system|uniref:Type II toxin-antitoxin system VapC family toxin n=1 Tax=Microcystis aeruginosa Ma_QC_C_20070703_M131 TaxID=2486263 RepID=A0A551YMA6_MICAE|nr:MAG: type II toxin-antitoxin system VapC family toxin [Microcystis aeruginosa Ma_QC_C_20070703_M131]